MMQEHEAMHIAGQVERGEPLDSKSINAIEHYELGGYDSRADRQVGNVFRAWFKSSRPLPNQNAMPVPAHPLASEQSTPTAHQCAMQLDLLMHPLQELGN